MKAEHISTIQDFYERRTELFKEKHVWPTMMVLHEVQRQRLMTEAMSLPAPATCVNRGDPEFPVVFKLFGCVVTTEERQRREEPLYEQLDKLERQWRIVGQVLVQKEFTKPRWIDQLKDELMVFDQLMKKTGL